MKAPYNKDKYITSYYAAAQLHVTRQADAFTKWLAEYFGVKPASSYLRGTHAHPLYKREDINWVEAELKKQREEAEAATTTAEAAPAPAAAPIAPVPNLPVAGDANALVASRLDILAQAIDSLITVQNQTTVLLQAMLDEMTRPRSAVSPQALPNGADRPQH